METLQLDAQIKSIIDNFNFDDVEHRSRGDIFSYSGLLNQIGCDHSSVMLEILSPETKKAEVQPNTPIHTPASRQPQPQYSSLSIKQHQQYLTYIEKLKNIDYSSLSRKEKHGFKDYKFLCSKVHEEQRQYHEYAFQIALQNICLYDTVRPEAENYIKHYLAYEKQRIQRYMSSYIFHQAIVISIIPYVNDPQPKFENFNVSMGKFTLLSIPESGLTIPPYEGYRRDSIHLKAISEDENAKKLATSWNADIVTSISALRTLADNSQPFSKEWEIPMLMQHLRGSNGAPRKVVFIDKALPPKSLNGREKMFRYFKKAVKQLLVNLSSPANESDEDSDDSESEEENDEDDDDDDDDGNCSSEDNEDDDVNRDTTNQSSRAMHNAPSCTTAGNLSGEVQIPQLDGTDDKSISKKDAPRRKTRLSSVPSAEARAPNLSAWTSSFESLPKSGLRQKKQTSQANLFPSWSSSRTNAKKTTDEDRLLNPAVDSEEDQLVIDSGDEDASEAKKGGGTSRDPKKPAVEGESASEQMEITFKATEIPSNILESVIGSDPDRASSPSSPVDVAPRRRSARIRMESASETDESKYNTRSTGVKSVEKDKKSTAASRQSDRKMRDKPELRRIPVEKPITSSRKRKTSEKAATKKPKSNENLAAMEAEVELKSNLQSTPIDEEVNRATNSNNQPNKSAALLRKAWLVGSPSVVPKSDVRKANPAKTPRSDDSSVDSSGKAEEESSDLLGQILNMQKGRKDKISYQDSSDLKKIHAMSLAVVPSVPSPLEADEMSFDNMLQLHKTKLAEPKKPVFYSLWSLGSYRILIRGCLHGKLRKTNNEEKHEQVVSIRTKLEYQFDLGFEKLSKSEACAEWLDLQFRPQPSVVLRCRVNPLESRFLRFEQIQNTQSTYQSYEASGFRSVLLVHAMRGVASVVQLHLHLTATKLLYSIFQKLLSNSTCLEGCYLMSHKSGASEVALRRSAKSPSSKMVIYDLQEEYTSPGRTVLCTPQTIPYNPLDPTKQTPWQMVNRRIPMTFDLKPKGESSREAGKKNKKKGKKKAKKTNADNE